MRGSYGVALALPGEHPKKVGGSVVYLVTSSLPLSLLGRGVPAFYSLAHTQTHTLSLSIYLSIFLSFYLSIFLSFYLSIFLSFYLSIFLSFYLSIFLSFYLSIFLSFYLSIFLSIYLSICLSIYLCTYRKRFHFPGSFLGKALRLLKELADPNATEADSW